MNPKFLKRASQKEKPHFLTSNFCLNKRFCHLPKDDIGIAFEKNRYLSKSIRIAKSSNGKRKYLKTTAKAENHKLLGKKKCSQKFLMNSEKVMYQKHFRIKLLKI